MSNQSSQSPAPIHCANPLAQYLANKEKIDAAIGRVLNKGWYILGSEVEKFEGAFAGYTGVSHCVGVANGTDALLLALKATGVGSGDEVITVSHSAVATTAAIELAGAVPVFVDIEAESWCFDPKAAEALISPKTKALLPVHIYGQPAPMEKIVELAQKYGLVLIEDCAQAHGAKIGDKLVGSFGDAAAFSFYPTKNLAALGDGGAVVTNSDSLYDRLCLLRQYGWRERYISEIPGMNSRLDELQASILSLRLNSLDKNNERRRQIAEQYDRAICGSSLIQPVRVSGTTSVMHQYVVRTPNRSEFRSFLLDRGIHTLLHYPAAIHQQPAYKGRIRGANNLRVTEALYEQIVSLPIYPELMQEEVDRISKALGDWGR